MEKDKKSDTTDEKLIEEIEKPGQVVEPGSEQKTEPESGAPSSEPDKKPVPDKELVEDFTTGLVKTLDIVQTRICLRVSESEPTEANKLYYNFDKDEVKALHGIWYPVVLKWYLKIPMEFVAVGITATILTAKFAKAKEDMIEGKK